MNLKPNKNIKKGLKSANSNNANYVLKITKYIVYVSLIHLYRI